MPHIPPTFTTMQSRPTTHKDHAMSITSHVHHRIIAQTPHVERFLHFSEIGVAVDHPSRRYATKAQGDALVREITPNATIVRCACGWVFSLYGLCVWPCRLVAGNMLTACRASGQSAWGGFCSLHRVCACVCARAWASPGWRPAHAYLVMYTSWDC